jgi:5-methylcytosine-specific restriction endonuclease McrA
MATIISHRTPPKGHSDYIVLATSQQQRKAAFARDKGVCTHCKQVSAAWDYDHIVELASVDRTNWPECLKYWTIEYGQTLCKACHRAKTIRGHKANAKVKRIRARADGTRRPRRKVQSRQIEKPSKPFKRTPDKQIGIL